MTKSGHSGRNRSLSSAGSPASRPRRTQAASGERTAPFGSSKPVEESKATPVPSSSAQRWRAAHRRPLRAPVSPPVGAITAMLPSALRSIRTSRFSWQNSKNCARLMSTAGGRCSSRAAKAEPLIEDRHDLRLPHAPGRNQRSRTACRNAPKRTPGTRQAPLCQATSSAVRAISLLLCDSCRGRSATGCTSTRNDARPARDVPVQGVSPPGAATSLAATVERPNRWSFGSIQRPASSRTRGRTRFEAGRRPARRRGRSG